MNFYFDQAPVSAPGSISEVPSGIKSKDELLDALVIALRLPDYFGNNWDALEECMRDLSWLPPGDVVISHQDLPLSDDRPALATYLSILSNAVESWRAYGERSLIVVFPAASKSALSALLAKTSS
jgi:RNAse (barnase) inhibitor barstar